jgi:hypothetical protein
MSFPSLGTLKLVLDNNNGVDQVISEVDEEGDHERFSNMEDVKTR